MRYQIINLGKKVFYYSNEIPDNRSELIINARPEWHTKEEALERRGYQKQDRKLMYQMGKLNELQ